MPPGAVIIRETYLLRKSSEVSRTGTTEPNNTPIPKPDELHADE